MRHHQILRALSILIVLTLLWSTSSSAKITNLQASTGPQAYVPGEILIKLRPGVAPEAAGTATFTGAPDLSALATRLGVKAIAPLFPEHDPSDIGLERIFKLSLPAESDVVAAVQAFAGSPGVEYAEPNYIYQIPDPPLETTDGGVTPQDMTLSALPGGALLPFTGSRSYTSGPHGAIGDDIAICYDQNIANMSGIDFAFARQSFPVVAIAGGTFLGYGSRATGAGNYVLIEHSNGIQSMYWHLATVSAEVRSLEVGQWIPRGFPIGDAGQSGGQTAIHLHLELKRGANASNPYSGTPVTWDGESLDGWTFYSFRVPGQTGQGINYRGSAVRGFTRQLAITNVSACADVRDNANADVIVASDYPEDSSTASNTANANTAFANYPGSKVLTSTNRLNRLTISGAPTKDFGGRTIGDSAEFSFRVHNHGTQAVSWLSNMVSGAAFSVTAGSPESGRNCGSDLAGGQWCEITVRFTPTFSGTHSGALTLGHTPAGETTPVVVEIKLTGTGLQTPPLYPNDPFFSEQYGLHNTGRNGGKLDADIDAPEAWGTIRFTPATMIAVIDTGIYYTHEDLNDGRVRTDLDWDYVNNDGDALDDFGHGTHVAGIIAARSNNGLGIAGVMQGAYLLPVKACNNQGKCFVDKVAQAIRYAADKGSRVINLSLGGFACSDALTDAINYAHFDKGAVVVAASGNDGNGVSYPASIDAVIAVGASDRRDVPASFSNHGAELDLVAPGRDIWTTAPRNGYDRHSGTSMSAPFVAGVAGTLIAQRPTLTNEQVRDILRQSADRLGAASFDELYGYGRVNLFQALQTPAPASPKPSARGKACPGCGASEAAALGADGDSLLANVRALRDGVFQQDPGRRWARVYYEHQLEVALMVATDASLSADVLAGWRKFDPVFQRLMDDEAPPVTLTPELIAAASEVMMGVAARGSPAVREAIVTEWQRVDPQRFVGWEVRDVWAKLVKENAQTPEIYLPSVHP